ncbi:Hypothetical protein CINCED_3A004366 [Cinara cedri]|uniref:Thiamine transporter SLC35F3 n=2 Tax=Cinara cedri TaxID=506608 RepID=A0A5E4MHI1_9HEMI|nr:Hypothetical protein CINCED_3A004366 [Cinara cedri]
MYTSVTSSRPLDQFKDTRVMKVETDVSTIFNPRKPRLSQSNAVLTSGSFSHVLSRSESLCQPEDVEQVEQCQRKQLGMFKRLKNKLCSKHARKVYYGLCVTFFVTTSWVGATHAIKYLYMYHPTKYPVLTGTGFNFSSIHQQTLMTYNAPFFTTWFCTNWTVLFFPLYFFCQLGSLNYQTATDILGESVRNFRDRGFTAAHFLTRCSMFCMLWVFTNYLYIHALSILVATDALALFAINVCCVYLLSWVILHDQFVGVRIVAVILCSTGVALLAYMDAGITNKKKTMTGVLLAALAAAGSAVYKVLFKKMIGDATYGQVSLIFSLIGLLNAALLWPVCLVLYFSEVEILHWDRLPWTILLSASTLSLANLLGNLSVAFTYDVFITFGLITAVPVSAAIDITIHDVQFYGMKLAGIILISIGFLLVMFPNNWPEYIFRLLRNIILLSHSAR